MVSYYYRRVYFTLRDLEEKTMTDIQIFIGAATTLFAGIVALMKYLLNQKDARITELETKNHELVERLLKSRGKK
jgi:hypothetical protein